MNHADSPYEGPHGADYAQLARDAAFLGVIVVAAVLFHARWLVVVGGGAWMLARAQRPIHILFAFAALFPFAQLDYGKPQIGPILLGFDDVMLGAMLGAYGIHRLGLRRPTGSTEHQGPLPRSTQWTIAFVGLYSAATLVSSLAVYEGIGNWVRTIANLMCFLSPLLLLRTPGQFRSMVSFLYVAGFAIAVATILSAYDVLGPLQTYLDPVSRITDGRGILGAKYGSSGLISSRGGFGVNLAFILPFAYQALAGAIAGRSRRRWQVVLHAAYVATVVFAIVVSGSRSGWLNLLILTCVFLASQIELGQRRRILVGAVLPLVVAVTAASAPYLIALSRSAYLIAPSSADARIELDLLALPVILRNPIFGVPQADIYEIGGMGRMVHNFFLAIAVNSGLIALIPVVALFISTTRHLFQAELWNDPDTRAVGICLVAGFAGIMTELMLYPGGDKHIWLYLGIINAFIVIAHRNRSAT